MHRKWIQAQNRRSRRFAAAARLAGSIALDTHAELMAFSPEGWGQMPTVRPVRQRIERRARSMAIGFRIPEPMCESSSDASENQHLG
jgi:hypothetical protein